MYDDRLLCIIHCIVGDLSRVRKVSQYTVKQRLQPEEEMTKGLGYGACVPEFLCS